jgi:AcrR family transcriptional regulator
VAGGRPRAFDADQALDRALEVFWSKGYEGASVADLTQAMGIRLSSFYAAFGNKEALFAKALDLYTDAQQRYFLDALALPRAADVVAAMLHGAVDAVTARSRPHGCLTVHGALAPSAAPQDVRERLTTTRMSGTTALTARLDQAKNEGDLPPHAHPTTLSRTVMTLIHGISVQAVSGADASELHLVADTITQSWRSLVDARPTAS